jgi:hypothetical protein
VQSVRAMPALPIEISLICRTPVRASCVSRKSPTNFGRKAANPVLHVGSGRQIYAIYVDGVLRCRATCSGETPCLSPIREVPKILSSLWPRDLPRPEPASRYQWQMDTEAKRQTRHRRCCAGLRSLPSTGQALSPWYSAPQHQSVRDRPYRVASCSCCSHRLEGIVRQKHLELARFPRPCRPWVACRRRS